MPFPRRDDIDAKDVALRWIGGESILSIASDLDAAMPTISRRLAEARRDFPDLPWADRVGNGAGSVKSYATMKDGKPGTSTVRPGSVVRGRKGRP